MDKLVEYRTLIKRLLTRYAELSGTKPTSGLETELIFDEEHDHYLLYTIGWWSEGRVCGATVHVRLKNKKFWIEQDWLEDGITTDLLEAGVPHEDIVLAFHPPEMRKHTEFAAT